MTAAKVMVVGGAGYVGSHACKALAAAGHLPVTYDNLSRGRAGAVKWGPLERGDVLDGTSLRDALARHRPAVVMHFAALSLVAESVADPALYYRNNVVGALCLLDAMRAEGVRGLVFSSSCAVYGIPARTPICEDAPLDPISPYGQTKLAIERALGDYAAAYGLACVALRYFNAAGADPDGEIGEDHDPETHLIPLVLDAAAEGGRVTVFGDDYPTDDGACVRDYVHVTDLAAAHVLASQSLEGRPGLRSYNLGAGRGYSVKEIIDGARRRTGRPIGVEVGPRRPGDPPVLTADAGRARVELGWMPTSSGLDEIIDSAWRWRLRRGTRGGDNGRG